MAGQLKLMKARGLAGKLGYVGLAADFLYSVFIGEPYFYQEVSYRVAGYKKILADKENKAEAIAAAGRGDHSIMEALNRASAELIYWEKIKDEMDKKLNSLSEKERGNWEFIQKGGA